MRNDSNFGSGVVVGIVTGACICVFLGLLDSFATKQYNTSLVQRQGYSSVAILQELDNTFVFSGIDKDGQFTTGIYRENINAAQQGTIVINSVLPNPAQ